MESKIDIKGFQSDPASKAKGTGMKKQKTHREDKYFEGGKHDKILMKGGNKELKKKKF
jgi:hypothetical protein